MQLCSTVPSTINVLLANVSYGYQNRQYQYIIYNDRVVRIYTDHESSRFRMALGVRARRYYSGVSALLGTAAVAVPGWFCVLLFFSAADVLLCNSNSYLY